MAAPGGSDRQQPSQGRHHQEPKLRDLPGGPKQPVCWTDVLHGRLQMASGVKRVSRAAARDTVAVIFETKSDASF